MGDDQNQFYRQETCFINTSFFTQQMSHFTWKSCTLVDHFLPPRRARFLQEKELAQKQSQSTKFEVDNNEKRRFV